MEGVRHTVHLIDGVQTIITNVSGNVAKGFILNKDLTTTPCYIAKHGNCFAHGETMRKAVEDAIKKHLSKSSVEEKINEFNKKFNRTDRYVAKEFYEWHGILTGSCKIGREYFCKSNNIEVSNKYTVQEFIDIVKDQYGYDVIKRLL